jgi:hypothetical protein
VLAHLVSEATRRWIAPVFLGLALSPKAFADECGPDPRGMACLDADNLWLRPSPREFVTVGTGMPATGTGGLMAQVGYVQRPIVVRAPSPDPAGRELRVVDHVVGMTLAGVYAPFPHLSIGLAAPFVLAQEGTGLVGITSQRGDSLAAPVVRDPRLHAAYEILERPTGRAGVGLLTGVDLVVPLGRASALAGERGFALGPWAAFTGGGAIWNAGLELGARLRRRAELAQTPLGHQASIATGLAIHTEDLAFGGGIEGRALPALQASERTSDAGDSVREWPVVAEWLVHVWAPLGRLQGTSVHLGLGGGLPLGSRELTASDGTSTTERLGAPTTPSFRALFAVQVYLPDALNRGTP